MKKKSLVENFNAWAINANSKEEHGFIGRYWWFKNIQPNIPPQLEGCQVSLFKTRKIARENLKRMKEKKYVPFPKAKVVKVHITIEE